MIQAKEQVAKQYVKDWGKTSEECKQTKEKEIGQERA